MKTYELTYIITPDANAEELSEKAKEVESAVQSRQGIIVKQQNPSSKMLSYPIKKKSSGFFGFIEFQAEPEALPSIQESLGKDAKILRSMVVIKEPVRRKKERGSKKTSLFNEAPKEAVLNAEPKTPAFEDRPEEPKKQEKPKVELKDIEEELDQILGE